MTDFEQRVRECYSTWSESYYRDYYGEQAAYPAVHRDILIGLLREAGAASVLDAGCGPASFLRDLRGEGMTLHGFDLTPEMVGEAQRVLGDDGEVWQGSVTRPEDFHPPERPSKTFDAAVCVGVLPHVPAEVDPEVLENLYGALRPGGLGVVEARNQLFALFTLNRYTFEFFRDQLVPGRPDEDLAPLRERFWMDLPPIRGGKEGEPGYDQVLSRTHNPFVLREQFEAAGFRDVRTLFYHFHDVPPALGPSVEASVALESPGDWRGHFMASAFLLAGTRA